MNKIDELIQKHCPNLPAGRQAAWSNNVDDLPSSNDKWYAYVLLCNNGSLYKGFTRNLYSRYQRHVSGDGALHTKRYKPICVLYFEEFDSETEAVKREKYFKSGIGREWLKQKIGVNNEQN